MPAGDNYFVALNSAVFSDGSFVYIPKGVHCPMELSTYFRINASETGQVSCLSIGGTRSWKQFLLRIMALGLIHHCTCLNLLVLVAAALSSNQFFRTIISNRYSFCTCFETQDAHPTACCDK